MPEDTRSDTERLDWVIFHSAKVSHSSDGEYCWVSWNNNGKQEETELCDNPRQAIDQAIKRTGSENHNEKRKPESKEVTLDCR